MIEVPSLVCFECNTSQYLNYKGIISCSKCDWEFLYNPEDKPCKVCFSPLYLTPIYSFCSNPNCREYIILFDYLIYQRTSLVHLSLLNDKEEFLKTSWGKLKCADRAFDFLRLIAKNISK